MSGFEVLTSDGKFQVLSTPPMHASEVANTPMPLDWTRVSRQNCAEGEEEKAEIRLPMDVVEEEAHAMFGEGQEDLVLVGTSGGKINKIGGLGHMKSLTNLILRSHLITTMEGLDR